MENLPTVSVIIPTHNRKNSLLRTLESVEQQSFPMDLLEVIVVDDGSTDDTPSIVNQPFPFRLRYAGQNNQGATAARNYGATLSQTEVLVFVDDDVTITPQALEALVKTCCQLPSVLVMGTLAKRSNNTESVYTAIALTLAGSYVPAYDDVDINFVDCNSELLACRRSDFLALGMFQDPTAGNGWPNWDDVDFGYRAQRNGFRILGTSKATAEHWDPNVIDRARACQRYFRVGKSAVWLFKRHPELEAAIPMLRDKTPPAWGQDSPRLTAQKMARTVMSSKPALWGMLLLVGILEQHYPSPAVLRRLYYWLHGAYLFQGYRAGIRQFALTGG